MRTIDKLLEEYGESHRNETNKLIHWICVPIIFFSIFGLLRCIPFPQTEFTSQTRLSWAVLLLIAVWFYYFKLSKTLSIGFLIWGSIVYIGNEYLYETLGTNGLLIFSISLFALAWVGQFIGHGIEGKKPSFLKDLQFLLIGPAWLMRFIYQSLGFSI